MSAERMQIAVEVDGVPVNTSVEPRYLLSDFLREAAGAPGVHVACGQGVCGACTVVMDGEAVRACLLLAVQAHGAKIRTVKSLPLLERDAQPSAEGLTRLQRAFREHHALQCGYCTPGLLVSTARFLAEHPQPSRDEILDHLNGHLCRCSGYANIVKAIESVVG